jgi:hypothetical protein
MGVHQVKKDYREVVEGGQQLRCGASQIFQQVVAGRRAAAAERLCCGWPVAGGRW